MTPTDNPVTTIDNPVTISDQEILNLFSGDFEYELETTRLATIAYNITRDKHEAEEETNRLFNSPPMVTSLVYTKTGWQNGKSYCASYEELTPAGTGQVVEGYMKIWPTSQAMGLPMATLDIIYKDGFDYVPTKFLLRGNYAIHTWPSGDRCIVSLVDGERISFYDGHMNGLVIISQ